MGRHVQWVMAVFAKADAFLWQIEHPAEIALAAEEKLRPGDAIPDVERRSAKGP